MKKAVTSFMLRTVLNRKCMSGLALAMRPLVPAGIVAGILLACAACQSTTDGAVATAGVTDLSPRLVPLPGKVELKKDGAFQLTGRTVIYWAGQGAEQEARTLAELLRPVTGLPLKVREFQTGAAGLRENSISLVASNAPGSPEAYSLVVEPSGIVMQGAPAGLFYAGQTLRQLLPPQVYETSQGAEAKKTAWTVPACVISDAPRFPWRGFMLDYARHFFDVAYTRRVLDVMAMHKLNVFHMHLTDDQGWRLEIKKYPKLTSVGAWRGTECAVPPPGPARWFPFEQDVKRYGGFFTQDDIREIVAYAAKLHINVMPEIDLPGHTMALIKAYPETLATVMALEEGDGYPIDYPPNAISPAKESNYRMIDDIMAEVAALFPFEYIHCGGDEVRKKLWKKCPQIKELIAREKLGNEHGAQIYFAKRLEGILVKHNRKMFAWGDSCNDKLARTTGMMTYLHGANEGDGISNMGFPVVLAPGDHCYFDMSYTDQNDEPGTNGGNTPGLNGDWAGHVNTAKSYSLNPNEARHKNIMGIQGVMFTEAEVPWKTKTGWSDFATGMQTVNYKVFPRLCALAEVAWTPQSRRNYDDFRLRMRQAHYELLSRMGFNFRLEQPELKRQGDGVGFLPPAIWDAEVRYTTDGSDPYNSATAVKWNGETIHDTDKLQARAFWRGQWSPLKGK